MLMICQNKLSYASLTDNLVYIEYWLVHQSRYTLQLFQYPCDRDLHAQPFRTQKAQSRKKKAHIPLHTS